MSNSITMAQAYDVLDTMAKAGRPLEGDARERFLADARAGKLHFAPPTDAQKRRFATRLNCHGAKVRLSEVASWKN